MNGTPTTAARARARATERRACPVEGATHRTGLTRDFLDDQVRAGGLRQGRLPPHHHPPAPGSRPHPQRIPAHPQGPPAPQELIHSCAHTGPGGHHRAGNVRMPDTSRRRT
jgi:hypothetical protein